MRRPTQAQVDSAASYLHGCRMAWGEHNLATVRALGEWQCLEAGRIVAREKRKRTKVLTSKRKGGTLDS